MIISVLYVFFGLAVILGMVVSFFFFTASIFDIFSLIFPGQGKRFNSLYGSPKICCIIIFILSSLYLLLFKFSYPYLFDIIREVLS